MACFSSSARNAQVAYAVPQCQMNPTGKIPYIKVEYTRAKLNKMNVANKKPVPPFSCISKSEREWVLFQVTS